MQANDVMAEIRNMLLKPVQFGGKSTVGRGICRLQLSANIQTDGGA
jgi:CRISPR/Cas system CMR subunit Cmr4 (Cas7 group RAMP superfamily)